MIYHFGHNAYFYGKKKRIEIKGYNEALVAFIFFPFSKNNAEMKNSKILLALMYLLCYIFSSEIFQNKTCFQGTQMNKFDKL